ncbi:MAG TPA: flagellar export protein FliJ [Planctomycetota bacterium]|nr:flagellar export protein FliJ [Planctomycetota bacterium]
MAKAFKFRFEQVLEVRRLKEEVAQRDLALAQNAVREQQERIARLLAEEDEGKLAIRGLKQKSIDVVQLRLQEGYLVSLERRIREAVAKLQELARTEAEKRKALVEARKAVKVLEKYRERKVRTYGVEQDRAERKFLDEVAQNMARMGT